MLENRMQISILFVAVVLSALSTSVAGTPADTESEFLTAVAEASNSVETGHKRAVLKAYNAIRTDFPEIIGLDFDVFVKAEVYYCKGMFSKAVRNYNKLQNEYPRSKLIDASLDREFDIGTAYLAGRKKTLLGIIKIKGYAEGIRIMELITDRVGLDTEMGIKASVAVAKNYEQRKKFNEAYLKWWEISLEWETGPVGRDALLGMARNKFAVYNKHPVNKRTFYDSSCLSSAKSYYERFKLLYLGDAREIGVDEILKEIDEQLAYKQLSIGRYYQKTGKIQSANLYYDMVVNNWPDTSAAQQARELLAEK